jgi:hypothetical protein
VDTADLRPFRKEGVTVSLFTIGVSFFFHITCLGIMKEINFVPMMSLKAIRKPLKNEEEEECALLCIIRRRRRPETGRWRLDLTCALM